MSNTPTSSAQVAEGLNLEAERAAPCPFCGGTATPMHTDDCYFVMQQKLRDAPKGDLSLVPEVLAAWNRRTAAPVAEGVILPPLPEVLMDHLSSLAWQYTAEQVRQAQREAVEADRRAREKEHLSEMAAWARENGLSIPPAWEATVINYGTNLDAMLRQFPELPEPKYSADDLADIFTAEQMFEYASKHVAPYAERIRQLERELADCK